MLEVAFGTESAARVYRAQSVTKATQGNALVVGSYAPNPRYLKMELMNTCVSAMSAGVLAGSSMLHDALHAHGILQRVPHLLAHR